MLVIRVLLLLAFAAVAPKIVDPQTQAQAQAPREALDGVDPVLLIQGKEVQGKNDFTVVRGRFTYLFASAENKATFEKQPDKYEIQLGGMCARMGGGATGNPSDYFVYDGKIYIFGSDDCHKKFAAAPQKFLPRPVVAMSSAATDLRQGRALVDRAVKALGGAERLDAVTTYVESTSQTQKRPTGDAAITTKTMYRLPGEVRVQRTVVTAERTFSTANLLTPAGSWYLSPDRAYPQLPESRASAEQEVMRQLVPLLRARRDADFKAAAVAGTTVAGVAEERVRIRHGAVDVTLGLEKASGRVHSISFTGRGIDAEIGDYTLVLGDFRTVGGLLLPFSERAIFNGAPDDFRTRKIDAIAINTPLEASLFEPAPGSVK
jgi:YHS domain-containing protein